MSGLWSIFGPSFRMDSCNNRVEFEFGSCLDLASVLAVERSEANVAISIITNINIAISQMEPANMNSGKRL